MDISIDYNGPDFEQSLWQRVNCCAAAAQQGKKQFSGERAGAKMLAIPRGYKMNARSSSIGIVVLILLGTVSCAAEECEQLKNSRQFKRALTVCSEEYERSSDCTPGASAAKAAFRLGRYDEVLTWRDRLRGSFCEGEGLYLAGWAHERMGDPAEFGASLEEAHRVFTRGFDREGRCELGLGAVKSVFDLGRFDAVTSWSDRLSETPCEAEFLVFAGRALSGMGKRDRAGAAFERAAELFTESGRHDQASHSYQRVYGVVRGDDHRGQLTAAISGYESAMRGNHRDHALRAASAIFEVLYDVGDCAGARWALDERRRLAAPDSKRDQLGLAMSRANLAEMSGYLDEAREYLDSAVALVEELKIPEPARGVYLNLVELDLLEGKLDAAERHLKAASRWDPDSGPTAASVFYRSQLLFERDDGIQAAQLLRSDLGRRKVPTEWLWRYENLIGAVALAQGNTAEAEVAFRRAIDVIEQMQGTLKIPNLNESLLNRKREPFERLFVLEAGRGRTLEALQIVERAKGRAFLNTLLNVRAAGDTAHRNALEQSLRRLQHLEAISSAYGRFEPIEPRPVGAAIDPLGDRQVVVYYQALDRFWLISIAGGEVRSIRLGGTVSEIEKLVRRFEAAPENARIAGRLAGILLPENAGVSWSGRILIVADRVLRNVPFAALPRDGRLLIEDAVISYVPSLNALMQIDREQPGTIAPPVVLGDPEGDLPRAAEEAREVAELLDAEAHVGKAADLDALRSARNASVLHLAAHSGVGAAGAWFALADGRFGTDVILTERLGARTVVLASCESAANTGPGLWGALGAAFLATGSRSVVATRWPVDDALTRKLVLRFYALGGADDPALALASSLRELAAQGVPISDWAAFITLGSNRGTDTLADRQGG